MENLKSPGGPIATRVKIFYLKKPSYIGLTVEMNGNKTVPM